MKKYDLIVAGGGFAGVAAAIASARKGLSVLIIEKSNCFGGAASNSFVLLFGGFFGGSEDKNGEFKYYSAGLFREIVDRLGEFGDEAIQGDCFNEEYLKLVLNRMVIESGAEILFHARLVDAKATDGLVQSVTVATKSGNLEFAADYFVDATGDADMAAMSGFPYQIGREEDGLCQGMSLCFRVCNADVELFKKERPALSELYHKYWQEGNSCNAFGWILAFPYVVSDGIVYFNSTRVIRRCPVDAFELTKAEIEAREMVFEVFEFVKKHSKCFEHASLLSTAPEIGVRESRKIIGEYILTGEDLVTLKRFPDTIAVGNFDIDIHSPDGSANTHRYFEKDEYYDIPYRSLIPRGSRNLLVAGRCISTDHQAQAAIRVMPTVCCMGEAAGLAAAIAKESNCGVSEIDIPQLQNDIKKNGGSVSF